MATSEVEQAVAPPFRGGAVAVFNAEREQAITGLLVLDIAGRSVVPAFGDITAAVEGRPLSSPIGGDGQFFLENVPPGKHPAVVTFGDVSCHVRLDVPPSDVAVLRLGTIRCAVEGK